MGAHPVSHPLKCVLQTGECFLSPLASGRCGALNPLKNSLWLSACTYSRISMYSFYKYKLRVSCSKILPAWVRQD